MRVGCHKTRVGHEVSRDDRVESDEDGQRKAEEDCDGGCEIERWPKAVGVHETCCHVHTSYRLFLVVSHHKDRTENKNQHINKYDNSN